MNETLDTQNLIGKNLEPQIVTEYELQEGKQKVLQLSDLNLQNQKLSKVSQSSLKLDDGGEENEQKSMRELLDQLEYNDERVLKEYINLYNYAETATPTGEIMPNYNVKLKALDRIAEIRGLLKKRGGGGDVNINLAALLYDK